MLLFPKGNNVDYLSLYLDVADAQCLPNGWTRLAHFGLSIVNQCDLKLTVRKGELMIIRWFHMKFLFFASCDSQAVATYIQKPSINSIAERMIGDLHRSCQFKTYMIAVKDT